MPRVMTERGQELLEMYPVKLRDIHFYQAVCNALGAEFDILDSELDRLQRNVIPSTADDLLWVYEALLGLSVNNPDLTLDERRAAVTAWLNRMISGDTTADFKHAGDIAIGTGWSYQAHDPTDPASPPPDHVVVHLPFEPGSVKANLAATLLGDIVDATVVLDVVYHTGFILDASLLDQDVF